MCDGVKEEIVWTIRVRATGQAFVNSDGYSFVFDDEASAAAFLASRGDDDALEIVALVAPRI
ncbi:MAG: hypothetical protein ACRDIY_16410 [Chloroflexota bacterium]